MKTKSIWVLLTFIFSFNLSAQVEVDGQEYVKSNKKIETWERVLHDMESSDDVQTQANILPVVKKAVGIAGKYFWQEIMMPHLKDRLSGSCKEQDARDLALGKAIREKFEQEAIADKLGIDVTDL